MKAVRKYTTSVIAIHWVHFFSLVALIITGFYIAYPFASGPSVMGWFRWAHFVFAYLITLALVWRVYLAFFSTVNADWRDFVPYWGRLKEIPNYMMSHIFLNEKYYRHYEPYNPAQSLTYLTFGVLIIIQFFTGFALYRGNFFGLVNSTILFRWVTVILGGEPVVRWVHHMVMWLFVVLTTIHIYFAIWATAVEKEGALGSIVTGYKLKR